MEKYQVLNLYAGIGGNRKLWDNVEVVAVENDKRIAELYKKYPSQYLSLYEVSILKTLQLQNNLVEHIL